MKLVRFKAEAVFQISSILERVVFIKPKKLKMKSNQKAFKLT